MSFFLQLLLQGLALGAVYALVGQGLNVTFWTLRVVNFAHGAFLMIAVFLALSAWTAGIPLGFAILIAVVAVAVMGVVLERVAVRPVIKHASGLGWIVATLGAAIVIEAIADHIYGPQVRSFPGIIFSASDYVDIFGVRMSLQLLLVAGVALVVLALFELVVRRTSWGMVLQATSHDSESARLRGIRVEAVVTTSFLVSAALAALAGVLIAPVTGISPAFGFTLLLNGFAAVVVGGVGSSVGTLVGGLTVGVAELMVGGYISTAAQSAVAFTVLILILMVRPSGLFGKREALKV
ncbi:amino acid/amide ABC transporter membrane protein 1 (HAAT family) [Blastococcus colisei]|uniref:Amino acid/amide ABC transporter membrane protein 1 (HAAT family) n=1 Tax=Blastococcus colisei TaxID=1564162 RepID=A0A543PG87_9ACTN|nr:branched-chain amino acid ABC transporter permease [Blastococcus colisei]TQN43056.1 amino acid/amide ABC transporter membrane protein 1 (HAAT family) [Blastococcus colisei]